MYNIYTLQCARYFYTQNQSYIGTDGLFQNCRECKTIFLHKIRLIFFKIVLIKSTIITNILFIFYLHKPHFCKCVKNILTKFLHQAVDVQCSVNIYGYLIRITYTYTGYDTLDGRDEGKKIRVHDIKYYNIFVYKYYTYRYSCSSVRCAAAIYILPFDGRATAVPTIYTYYNPRLDFQMSHYDVNNNKEKKKSANLR